MSDLEMAVSLVLSRHTGRANAIKSNMIAQIVEAPERAVRLAIREIIRNGTPVLSATEAPAGYFIGQTWTEVMRYAKALKARGIEDIIRRRDIIRAARSTVPPEQLELIAR